MAMTRTQAELLAAQVLDWLAGDPARIGAFMAACGTDPAALRAQAGTPEMLLAVLDFLLSDEAMLLACCADLGVAPTAPAMAQAALPGGAQYHWT